MRCPGDCAWASVASVKVTSLGFRTDLMLRKLAASTITDCVSHLVIRTPANPGFWWGNFVLFGTPPGQGDAGRWRAIFAEEFPDASHLALGVDGTTGEAGDMGELAELGVTVEVSTVLTATRLRPPAEPKLDATYRPLTDNDDWAQAVALRMRCGEYPETSDHRQFTERKLAESRKISENNYGTWFGAFAHGRMRSSLGLFTDGSGMARFQDVETDPEYRGQGLASNLVYQAGLHGSRELGAHTLVIVADPTHIAIRIYHALGFTDRESQVQLQRDPANGPANGPATRHTVTR